MNRVAPAIVVLGHNSVSVARQIMTVLSGATLYGLVDRTSDVDVSFVNFGLMLRELFGSGTPTGLTQLSHAIAATQLRQGDVGKRCECR